MASTATLEPGVYFIRNIGSTTVMEVPGGASTGSPQIIGHTQRALNDLLVASQLWIVSQVGNDNTYMIENANSRTLLTLTYARVADDTSIVAFMPTGNVDQLWTITRSTNADFSAFVIANKGSGTFANLDGE